MVKYGILNTSRIIGRFIKAVGMSEGGVVTCVGSRSLEKAKAAADEYAVEKYYGSYEEVYKDPDVDVVYISTINNLHYENAMESLKHGKHVLLEKPFTLTVKEAKKLFAFAKEKNLFLMEAQKQVFIPLLIKIRDMINNNPEKFGKITMIDFKNYVDGDLTSWILNGDVGGGLLYAHATYAIEFVQFMTESLIEKYTGLATNGPKYKGDDQNTILMISKDNQVLSTDIVTSRSKVDMYAMITTEKAELYMKDYYRAHEVKIRYFDGSPEEIIKEPLENEMVFEVNHVNECIEKGLITSPVMTPEITINTTEVLEGCYKDFYK